MTLGILNRALVLLLLPLGVAACSATTGGQSPKAQADQRDAVLLPLGDDEVLSHLSALPPQNMPDGDCGLFLWLKRDDSPLVFFQKSDGQAHMAIDGSVAPLNRTANSGRIALSYYEAQSFTGPGISLDVTVTPESKRSLQQGLKLPTGSLSVEVDGGWSAVLPVVGLIGCK